MMNYKKQFKKDVLNELTPNDKYNEITAKLNLKPQSNNNFMKKGLIIASSAVCLSLIVGVGAYFLVKGNFNQQPTVLSANSIVKMNLNPSITMMVDDENKVVSITGENEEGKMIIVGEEIQGKTLEEAIEIILTIENETGYLVSGNATIEDNKLSISVSVDDEEIQKNIEERISSTVEAVCNELNVNETLTYVEISLDEYKQQLLSYDPTLTLQEVEKMNFDEVYTSLQSSYEELAAMYSQEIIDLYNQSKEYEFKFAESDFTFEVIKGLGGLQAALLQSVFETYEITMSQIENSIDLLNQARYDNFVNEESLYSKANEQMKLAKAEVIKYKNQLASDTTLTNEQKAEIESMLQSQLSHLENSTLSLQEIRVNAEKVIDDLEKSLIKLMDKITEFKDQIVSFLNINIEEEVSKKATELDAYLNETKTQMFTEFETTYAEDIAKAKQNLLAYKESLKQQNSVSE